MLFYNPEFIFIFLSATLTGYYLLGRYEERLAFLWLAAASLVFYGYWSTTYLPLITVSILGSYWAGVRITRVVKNRNSVVTEISALGLGDPQTRNNGVFA